MERFAIGHAAGEDWAAAVESCLRDLGDGPFGDGPGFVYATDHMADHLADIVEGLRGGTGVEQWVGCLGIGISAGGEEYFDRPALAVMVAPFDAGAYRILPTLTEGADQLSADDRAWIAETAPVLGLVHGDPAHPHITELIDDVAEDTASFLVGGLTSSRGPHHQVARGVTGGGVTGGGVSGILFAPEVDVVTRLSQGCVPVAGSHVVSDCVDNVLIGLDGRPALDVFKDDIGAQSTQDLGRLAGSVHVAITVEGSDTGDYMVRNLVGIDPARGWLAIGDQVRPGQRIVFVRRDPASAEGDLLAMLETIKRRAAKPPRGGLYVSCVARGPNMFGAVGRESAIIRDALGDVPVVGFFANGEISNNRLYGYTGVLTLFL